MNKLSSEALAKEFKVSKKTLQNRKLKLGIVGIVGDKEYKLLKNNLNDKPIRKVNITKTQTIKLNENIKDLQQRLEWKENEIDSKNKEIDLQQDNIEKMKVKYIEYRDMEKEFSIQRDELVFLKKRNWFERVINKKFKK